MREDRYTSYLKWVKDLDAQISRLHARDVPFANFAGSSLRASLDLTALRSDCRSYFDAQGPWGYPGLVEALSRNYGIPQDRILVSSGAGLAMFLVCRAVLKPDGLALVECPVYEPFLAAPRACGNGFVLLDRCPGTFEIDPSEFEDKLKQNARVQVAILSNPHNPTGTVIPDEQILQLASIAERHGVILIVDEIFRDLLPTASSPLALQQRNIISISSLSKVYGFSQLRCSWIVCAPESRLEIQDTKIAIDNIGSPFLEALASTVINELPHRRELALKRLKANTATVPSRFRELQAQGLIQGSLVPGQVICFPLLPRITDVPAFVDALAQENVFVIDGTHFRAPGHIRMGFGSDPNQIEPGLDRFEAVLRQHSAT